MENQTRMFAALFHDLASCFLLCFVYVCMYVCMYVCTYASSSLLIVLLRYSLDR